MGYVHTDKPDILFIYAHVDDEPDPAFPDRPGWVTTLVRGLEKRPAKKLGRVDSSGLWRDAQLAGHEELTPEILGRPRDAAVLLLVLSPAYLAPEWCRRERAAFHEKIPRRKDARGRIFVVECDRVDPGRKPPELAVITGYRFWVEDPDTGNPETLGDPIVREKDEEYHKRLNDRCIDLARDGGVPNPPPIRSPIHRASRGRAQPRVAQAKTARSLVNQAARPRGSGSVSGPRTLRQRRADDRCAASPLKRSGRSCRGAGIVSADGLVTNSKTRYRSGLSLWPGPAMSTTIASDRLKS
jgi:TIR domain